MIYLLLSILSSTSISLILKFNSHKKGNEYFVIAGNYLTASIIAAGFYFFEKDAIVSWDIVFMGAFVGMFFFLTFILFAKSIEVAGMALATVSSRLSVAVAILLSVLFFNEIPELNDYIGFIFSAITIILFSQSLSKSEHKLTKKDYIYLMGLLLGIGLNDFMIKVFEETRQVAEKQFFILMIFISALIYTTVYIIVKKIKFESASFKRGLILGVPNVFSTVFFLLALGSLKAIIVFPLNNIGVILLSTLLAIAIFKEKTSRKGILSIISGIIAILFLSL